MNRDEYLAELAARTRGTAPERLLAELRDHIEDATRHHDECDALARLGAPEEVAAAWTAHVRRRRSQTRRRAAVLALTVASAVSLAVAQHASGGHSAPQQHCAVGHHLGVGRSAHCLGPVRSR